MSGNFKSRQSFLKVNHFKTVTMNKKQVEFSAVMSLNFLTNNEQKYINITKEPFFDACFLYVTSVNNPLLKPIKNINPRRGCRVASQWMLIELNAKRRETKQIREKSRCHANKIICPNFIGRSLVWYLCPCSRARKHYFTRIIQTQ